MKRLGNHSTALALALALLKRPPQALARMVWLLKDGWFSLEQWISGSLRTIEL